MLKNGRTAHSAFKIPIPCDAEAVCNFNVGTDVSENLKDVDLIIWDAFAMFNLHLFVAVKRTLKYVMKNAFEFR